jgi:hypothetical protein
MATEDLVALNAAAREEHGKADGELPIKLWTTTSAPLGAALAAHEPADDLEGSGTLWRLRQPGAKKVWSQLVTEGDYNLRGTVVAQLVSTADAEVIPVAGGDHAVWSDGNNHVYSDGNQKVYSNQ